MKELCQLWKVEKSKTTPYHPQGNGVVERGNKDLGNSLRSLLLDRDDDDWDLILPHLTRSLRGVPHSFTGETPNYLMFGRELSLPDNLLSGPTEELSNREDYAARIANRLSEAYDMLRGKQQEIRNSDRQQPPLFTEGDQVWIKNKRHKKNTTAKLQPKWIGPYTVIKANDNHTYVLEINGKQSLEHEGRLKLHVSATQNWGRAPRIPELVKQPTRSGYPKPLPKRPAETEEKILLPEALQIAPTIKETESLVIVTPKTSTKNSLPVITEKSEEEIIEESTPETEIKEKIPLATPETDRLKRTRKIPEKLKDFVVYQISQNETTQEERLLDNGDWPRLPERKKDDSPLRRAKNWGRTNYPIRSKDCATTRIKEPVAKSISHNLPKTANMRAKYTSKETLSDTSSSSSSSSDSSDSELELQQTMKTLDHIEQEKVIEPDQGEVDQKPQEQKETPKISRITAPDQKKGNNYISLATAKEQKDLYDYIREFQFCRTCHQTINKSPEQARLHAWSHFVVYACEECGYLASYSGSIYYHSKQHATRTHGVRIDKDSWKTAREDIQIQRSCPPLPYKYETSHRKTSGPRQRKMHSPTKKSSPPRRKSSPKKSIDEIFSMTITKPISPVRPFIREKPRSPKATKDISFKPYPTEHKKAVTSYRESSESIISRQTKTSTTHRAEVPMSTQMIPSIHHIQTSPPRNRDKLAEQQPYRITAKEQQLGLHLLNNQLQFLTQVKVSHLKVLADIDTQISQIKRDKLKFQYPSNTY